MSKSLSCINSYRLTEFICVSGMLESCVAPILILIISMFYRKDEQVGPPPASLYQSGTEDDAGIKNIVVLLDGKPVHQNIHIATC